jgi:cytosine/creatinine deaminase
MITNRAAQILGVTEHRVAVGAAADLVVLDCASAAQAVAQIATPLFAFKRGRMTVSRAPAVLHRP